MRSVVFTALCIIIYHASAALKDESTLEGIVAKMTPQEKARQLDTAEGSLFVSHGRFNASAASQALRGATHLYLLQ